MRYKQTPISLKLDEDTLESLQFECDQSGVKRNRIINIAIDWYCQLKRIERLDGSLRQWRASQFLRDRLGIEV